MAPDMTDKQNVNPNNCIFEPLDKDSKITIAQSTITNSKIIIINNGPITCPSCNYDLTDLGKVDSINDGLNGKDNPINEFPIAGLHEKVIVKEYFGTPIERIRKYISENN
jgi:hypothetical protein